MKKILLLIASAAIALAVNAAPQKVDFGKLPMLYFDYPFWISPMLLIWPAKPISL